MESEPHADAAPLPPLTGVAAATLDQAALAEGPARPGPLTLAKQGSFFVGERDVHSDTLSTAPRTPPRERRPSTKYTTALSS